MWALIRKEILENVRWLPLALLLTCSLTLSAVTGGIEGIDRLLWTTTYGSSLVAIALGLLQSIPDQRNGARAYLLHRGVTAAQVFWAKTLVGLGLVLLSVGVPLALCALWLSMRGVLYSPGRAIQVLPPAAIALSGCLFHPTVMLVIYRPARWIGSRVLPMLLPIVALTWSQSRFGGLINAGDVWWVSGVSLVMLAVLVSAARCAYVDLARLPAAHAKAHRHPAVMLVLVSSMLALVAMLGLAIFAVDQAFRTPVSWYYATIMNRSDRQLWLMRITDRWSKEKNEREAVFLNGGPLTGAGMPEISGSAPADFALDDYIQLNRQAGQENYGMRDIAYRSFQGLFPSQRWSTLLDLRGYILCYDYSRSVSDRLGQVISRDGIRDPKGDWGQPFQEMSVVTDYRQLNLGLLVDHNGIYQLDETSGTIRTLAECQANRAALTAAPDTPLRMFVRSGAKLLVFELTDSSGVITVPKEYGRLELNGQLSAVRIAEIELPQTVAQLPYWNIYYRSVDDWAVHSTGGLGAYGIGSVARKKVGQQSVDVFTIESPPETYVTPMRDVRIASLLSAPVPSLLTPFYTYLTAGRQQHKTLAEVASVPADLLPGVVATFLLQGLVAAVVAWYMAERRRLSYRAKSIWAALGVVLGWAAPLAVLACYPRVVCEACSHCQKARRIDLVHCEHCHASWERPQREGIEIIEHEFDEVRPSEKVELG